MVIGGRSIAEELLPRLEAFGASCSRRRLAQHLCQWAQWQGPTGQAPLMAARKALAQLVRTGHLRLPPAGPSPPKRIPLPPAERVGAATDPLRGPLEWFTPLEVVLVKGRALSRQWNELLDQHHYLGAGPLCGAQLRYLIRSSQGTVLAALAFSGAARQLAGRDRWIGWSAAARRENLHLIVNNSRFLMLPVEIPNLASHLLARVLARLPEDWQARYGYRPVLVETFVERNRYRGDGYRAANWQAIALSKGRGRQDRERHPTARPLKTLWVYPLQKDFRRHLDQMPAQPRWPCAPSPPPAPTISPQDWAEVEFGQAPLGDPRLNQRLCTLARDLYARPQAQLPEACGSRAKTKAAYRFFDHPKTSMQVILHAHYQATAQRVAAHPVVLAVQDTTSLNYSAHPATEMLGLIGSEKDGAIGMLVHSTLAFDEAGTPLGLLDVQCWVRDPEDFGKKHARHQLPLEAKESVRWLRSLQALEQVQARCPKTQLVGVGDREADIYELFIWAAQKARPALLVRAEKDRLLSDGQAHLWAQLAAQPPAGTIEVKLPRRQPRAARVAQLEVRFAAVELKAPVRKTRLGPVRVWAVQARETHPPAGAEPVEWMLLSSLAVENLAQALEKLRWYAGRWDIEIFHRVLKSGCKIETRQLAGADRLETCLGIDLVVAWRIHHLTKLGRETPEVPCTVYFEEHQWQALVAYLQQSPDIPQEPPTLRQATRMVASLGGFLGRRGDGEPGTQTLWIGLQRLDDLAAMFEVMRGGGRKHPTVSSNRTYG